jgi:hypothetical protein
MALKRAPADDEAAPRGPGVDELMCALTEATMIVEDLPAEQRDALGFSAWLDCEPRVARPFGRMHVRRSEPLRGRSYAVREPASRPTLLRASLGAAPAPRWPARGAGVRR